jgi:branched-chain amino acid transport system ATP-binding protein
MLLELENVDAFYGASHVLRKVTFSVEKGETVSLLGRNGAGKTTTLHAIMGVHQEARGSVTYDGHELLGLPAFKVMQYGIGLVPEGRQIFPTLTVFENLKMGYIGKKGTADYWAFDAYLDEVFRLFPRLKERLKNTGRQLSGGEQQMLAVARALGSRPQFLMLDEPTEGLAPIYVERISETIEELQRQHVSMLLVTQDTKLAMKVSSGIFFMEKGSICYEGTSQEVADHPEVRIRYLGV